MPAPSKKSRRLWGAAYGAKKKGKKKPSYVPMSMWGQSLPKMREWAKQPQKDKKR